MRKRILDIGNEVNRDLNKYFELINLNLDEQKLNETQQIRLGNLIKHSKNTRIVSENSKIKVKGKII